jgi:type II secretory pathway pseudopilin PulG
MQLSSLQRVIAQEYGSERRTGSRQRAIPDLASLRFAKDALASVPDMRESRRRGFTLLGLLGVMAVLAILAAVLIPSAIRKLDQIAGDKEIVALKSLAAAFERSITRNQTIPAHANWAQAVATELGVNLPSVTTNLRRQPRVLLIDPEFLVGDATYVYGDAYVQGNFGSVLQDADDRVIPPVSPRMIILSSIGVPLPNAVVNWSPASGWTADDFDGVWDWNDAGNTAPTGDAWAGWTGARDLKVQRVNLAPLFVHVVLTTYTSDGEGQFSFDGVNLAPAPLNVTGHDAYYLQDTPLQLHSHLTGNPLQTQLILTRDISFVYQQNVWRSTIEGVGFAGGMDIGTIVDRFLRAPGNPNSLAALEGYDPKLQQLRVVDAFKAYMQAYLTWEAAGFPNDALRAAATAAQSAMMDTVQELYKYPDHVPPEVPCPE